MGAYPGLLGSLFIHLPSIVRTQERIPFHANLYGTGLVFCFILLNLNTTFI
uniref:Uncharacterized protein n=1 Tax=Arundo donax TaxID=35708 RepID=A0A0A9A9Q2_ARUDO